MTNIEKISQIINQIERQIESIRSFQEKSSSNDELRLLSLNSLLTQLNKEKADYYKDRYKEILEIKLIGKEFFNGSLPLSLLYHLCHSTFNSLFHLAKYLEYGLHNSRMITKKINHLLDLRLEGIESGSSQIYISGLTNLNIFNDSVIQKTFKKFFETLQLLEDDTSEVVEFIGEESLKGVSSLMKNLYPYKPEVVFTWESDIETYQWVGDKSKIKAVKNNLSKITIEPKIQSQITGEIILLSQKGIVDVKSNNETLRINYIDDDYNLIEQLRLGQIVNIVMETIIMKNQQSNKSKKSNYLVHILQK